MHLEQGGTGVVASKGVRQANVVSLKRPCGFRIRVSLPFFEVSMTVYRSVVVAGKIST